MITSQAFLTTLTRSLLPLLALGLVSTTTLAAPSETTEATQAHESDRSHSKRKHGMMKMKHMSSVINAYKLGKGEITLEEIKAQKEERKAKYQAMRALKESGDEDAINAKKEELRSAAKVKHEEFKAYLEANPKLKEYLNTMRKHKHHGDKGERPHYSDDE